MYLNVIYKMRFSNLSKIFCLYNVLFNINFKVNNQDICNKKFKLKNFPYMYYIVVGI